MTEIIIIICLVLANGVFAGAEIAVVALRKSRIQELAGAGSRRARAVMALRERPERFLATVQVGITIVGATAAAFGGATIAARLAPTLAEVGWIGERADDVALAIVIAGVSYLSIVVGELVPKSLALRGAETYALLIGRPLLALSWLATPLVWLLSASANVVLRPFGDSTTFTETRHSADELQQLVEDAARDGTIHPDAGEIASRALELPDLSVADVMVPRQEVVMTSRRAPSEELRRLFRTHIHSRIPVYDDRVDNIVGYIGRKDLLAQLLDGKDLTLDELVRPPFFVPEQKNAVELLEEMRAKHLPLAIVVDEQGGVSGIVTMEDILEELVGEIFDEHVQNAPRLIEKESDGSAMISGAAPIREVNRALDVELPDDGSWTTIAGLCLALAGRIPTAGHTLSLPSGVIIEIADASARRVRRVRLRLPPLAAQAHDREPPDSGGT